MCAREPVPKFGEAGPFVLSHFHTLKSPQPLNHRIRVKARNGYLFLLLLGKQDHCHLLELSNFHNYFKI